MKYIKLDYTKVNTDQQNYIYLLEIDDDGMVEKQLALDKNNKILHKITADIPTGDFRWEFNKFSEEEIERYKITKEEFFQYW